MSPRTPLTIFEWLPLSYKFFGAIFARHHILSIFAILGKVRRSNVFEDLNARRSKIAEEDIKAHVQGPKSKTTR